MNTKTTNKVVTYGYGTRYPVERRGDMPLLLLFRKDGDLSGFAGGFCMDTAGY